MDDRNIADRKMGIPDLPIFLSWLPRETKERKLDMVLKSAEPAAVLDRVY
jgi:hypothetical protein